MRAATRSVHSTAHSVFNSSDRSVTEDATSDLALASGGPTFPLQALVEVERYRGLKTRATVNLASRRRCRRLTPSGALSGDLLRLGVPLRPPNDAFEGWLWSRQYILRLGRTQAERGKSGDKARRYPAMSIFQQTAGRSVVLTVGVNGRGGCGAPLPQFSHLLDRVER